MEALSRAFFRRELGLMPNYKKPLLDIKKLIQKLECREEDKFIVAENEENLMVQTPIFDMKFCPIQFHPHLLAVSDELGYISVVNTKEGESDHDKVVLKHRCHENALSSLDWSMHKDGLIASCSGDSTVKVWEIKNDFESPRTLKGHSQRVKAVKFHPIDPECLVSSGRDGNILFWDLRSGDSPCNMIRKAHDILSSTKSKELTPTTVTDILYYEEHTVISCGAKDGVIKFWDTRKPYTNLKKMIPVSTLEWPKENDFFIGYSSMCLDQQNNLYANSCNEIFKFNLSSKVGSKEPATFLPPYKCSNNYYVKFDVSPDGRFLVSGSADLPDVYVWDVYDPTPDPFLSLKSDSESTGIAVFSPHDPLMIACGSDDGRVFIWRSKRGNESDSEPSVNGASTKWNKFYESHSASSNHFDDDGGGDNNSDDSEETSSIDPASTTRLNKKQEEANKREAEIASLTSNLKLKTLYPKNGLFLTNLLEKNCHNHFNNHNNNDDASDMDGSHTATNSNKKEFDLGSLLKDLPNFAIDGKHPNIPECSQSSYKKPLNGTAGRKPCWLGELKLTLSSPSSPSNIHNSNNNNNSASSSPINGVSTSKRGNNNSRITISNPSPGPGKRLYSKVSTAKDTLHPNQQRPPKRLKLKLKAKPPPNINTTPKRSPKPRINSGIRNGGRRNSIEASGSLTSPNIMKYFSVPIQPIAFHLPAESS